MSSQTPSPFIVEVENAWKVYQTGSVRVEALRGVNMGVKRGEMIAVMGPSGCGKTTLLNCFSGLDDLSKGKVTVEGVDLAKMSDDQKSEFRAKRMGFIFQAYNLLPVLTAQENVELPLLLAGGSESEAHATSLDVLKMVGLGEWRSHKPMELSGGQQQRVTVARALVNKPAIVWADEPTGNLDSENSQEIIKLLRSLNQQYGLTLVLVSHDTQIAQQTDRIIRMRNGPLSGASLTSLEAYGVGVLLLITLGMMARDRITLKMSLRNFTRRKTNMAIVIAGLMIGTAMISGSLVT